MDALQPTGLDGGNVEGSQGGSVSAGVFPAEAKAVENCRSPYSLWIRAARLRRESAPSAMLDPDPRFCNRGSFAQLASEVS